MHWIEVGIDDTGFEAEAAKCKSLVALCEAAERVPNSDLQLLTVWLMSNLCYAS